MVSLGMVAERLDRAGLRRPVAWLASWVKPGQTFTVDARGNWVNRQADCTIVSPGIHIAVLDDIRATVLENWCVHYVPREGDIVVDVGAGIGEEAIVFAALAGASGKVVAIEAHPDTFACLEGTLAGSGTENVVPRNCAIADGEGELSISTTDNHLANSVMAGESGHKVRTQSLDSLAHELGLERIDFLKMNIEGAEKLAVRGMTGFAPKIRNLCISCHDFVADETGDEAFRSREEVKAWLLANGFTLLANPAPADKPWQCDYLFAKRAA